MPLVALGINHNSASVDVREKVAFAPEQMATALTHARDHANIQELAILSTCNRTEIYAHADASSTDVLQWLASFHQMDARELADCHYWYQGESAARHMMQVASGLDSLVLGEPQILGQMKSAYAVAHEAGSVANGLHNAFHQVFSIAKKVRSDTAIGENPVSVAYAAVSLSQQIFTDLHDVSALLIGAGETIELVTRHLVEAGVKRIIVANRTLGRARDLAEQFGAEAILLSDIPEYLHRADMVISSTASQLPILGKGAVETALKQRKHQPMFMVDIAVPRDIESEVADLDDVYLYTVDDLSEVIAENRRSREEAAKQAEAIVDKGVERYQRELRAMDSVATIKAYRQKVDALRDQELEKALANLRKGSAAEDVLAQLARNLSNKLSHSPTAKLKQASAAGRSEVITITQELFDLSEMDTPARDS